MKACKDCLACKQSFSEEAENENDDDKLYCMVKKEYVKEDGICRHFTD